MFKRSHIAEVTPESPKFKVRYLGKRETSVARGQGCTQEIMKALWGDAGDERQMSKVSLTIHRKSIEIKWLDSRDRKEESVPMHTITYCSVDKTVNNRIFSWVFSEEQAGTSASRAKYWCIAVVARSSEKARALSVVLHRSFHTFYNDSIAAARSASRTATPQLGRTEEIPREGDEVISESRTGAASQLHSEVVAHNLQSSLYADEEITYDEALPSSHGGFGTNIYYGLEAIAKIGEIDQSAGTPLPSDGEHRKGAPCTSL